MNKNKRKVTLELSIETLFWVRHFLNNVKLDRSTTHLVKHLDKYDKAVEKYMKDNNLFF